MALITCPECRAQVSSDALKCPSCGKRLRRSLLFKLVLGVFSAAALFVLWASIRSSDPAVQDEITSGTAIDECWRKFEAESSAGAREIIGGACRILQERYREKHNKAYYGARP